MTNYMESIMTIIFIVVFYLMTELTYQVAVHQQQGMVRFISAGVQCWINRIVLVVPTIRLLGWIPGGIFSVIALFTFTHLTLGWIFTIPSLFINDEKKLLSYVDFECRMLIPANIIALILAVASFFVPYKSAFECVRPYFIPLLIVSTVGFLARMIVSLGLKKKYGY